jgi:arylsulfatase A-like enzyme
MRRAFVAVCALAAAACGGGGDGARRDGGVVHLDPRLADGRSVVEALRGESRVVRTWTPRGPDTAAPDLAPWAARNGLFLAPKGAAGVRVRAADYDPARGIDKAFLVLEEPLEAHTADALELDVSYYDSPSAPGRASSGGVALLWDAAGGAGGAPRVEVSTGPDDGLQTVRLRLAEHSAWRGTIRGLALYPAVRGGQTFDVHGVRFVRGGFEPGPARGADTGDAGLLGIGGDLRRTWVADLDVPLFARARVPAGGALVVDVAVSGSLRQGHDAARFMVDVRVGGAWVERGRRSLAPARGSSARRWRTLRADLSDLAGREVELRLRVTVDGDGTGGALERARAWWGAPLLTGARRAGARPHVMLVTLDTLRADALGCYGGPPDTPALDALAADGLLFERAWSACNSTLPSHASILTGLEVPAHGVLDNRSALAADVPTLAQALRAAGYETAAAVSVQHLQAGYSGLGAGFDRYLDVQPGAELDGAGTLEGVRRWVDGWSAAGERPLFLWVHLFDPHTPYGPPAAFLADYARRRSARGAPPPARDAQPADVGVTRYTQPGEFLAGVTSNAYARFLYEAGVAYTDTLVGDLRDTWDEAAFVGETAWIVTADHGESLGEHEIWYSHEMLHAQVVHVPLLLRLPGGPRGARVAARVSTLDIACTLRDLLRLDGPGTSGVSLLAAARGAAPADRRVHFVHGGLVQIGCRDAAAHFFQNTVDYRVLGDERSSPAGAAWLYDPADLACSERLEGARPELVERYGARVARWLEEARSGRHLRAAVSAEDEARLQGMGYAGGHGEDGAPGR